MDTPELVHTKRTAPEFARRRMLVLACGGAALAGLASGCATPAAPQGAPLGRMVAARAPRVGDTWRYQYTSAWRNVAPRAMVVRVTAVTADGVRDELRVEGARGGAAEGDFGSRLEVSQRPVGGVDVRELSPYLQAFDMPAPGAGAQVAMPPAGWGGAWIGSARFGGTERIVVPAGTFDTTRVDVFGRRFFIGGQMDDAIDPVKLYLSAWYAPQVKRFVRLTFATYATQLNPLAQDLYELAEYKVGQGRSD
ncbi:MAG: hypothetical protein IT515_13640 [Burkholderiales bacterium]|nr:hypothetical protein [Burkholderiales bacterium]